MNRSLLGALALLLCFAAAPASAQFSGPVTRGVAPVYTAVVALGNTTTTYSPSIGDGGDAHVILSASDDLAISVTVPNTAGNIDVNVEGSFDGGATWVPLVAPTITQDLDTESAGYTLDTSAYYAPLYRFAFVAAANDADKTATLRVAVLRN